jgi:hypothetical protein
MCVRLIACVRPVLRPSYHVLPLMCALVRYASRPWHAAVGHDYQDVESAYCTGIDCAVEDEHEVIFPVTLGTGETPLHFSA